MGREKEKGGGGTGKGREEGREGRRETETETETIHIHSSEFLLVLLWFHATHTHTHTHIHTLFCPRLEGSSLRYSSLEMILTDTPRCALYSFPRPSQSSQSDKKNGPSQVVVLWEFKDARPNILSVTPISLQREWPLWHARQEE
jgi:hypothetical protein